MAKDLFIVEGEYSALENGVINCDKLHAFESRKISDPNDPTKEISQPVGQMNTKVKNKIDELVQQGYKVKVTRVTVGVVGDKVKYFVTISESDDGFNWVGFTSRGAGCNGGIDIRWDSEKDGNGTSSIIKRIKETYKKNVGKIELVSTRGGTPKSTDVTYPDGGTAPYRYNSGGNSFIQGFYRYYFEEPDIQQQSTNTNQQGVNQQQTPSTNSTQQTNQPISKSDNKKISSVELESNDVATVGSQGNSVIVHDDGAVSVRAANKNEDEVTKPSKDDTSGIYVSPGDKKIEAKTEQTNYQTVNTNDKDVVTPNPVTPGKAILLGDSQTPSIKAFSKKLQPLTAPGILWKAGWFVKDLKAAVSIYPKDLTIAKVFINIGTNGNYSKSDDIKGLITAIQTTFPNASLYVIEGSTGWGGVKDTTRDTIDAYYNRFIALGVTKLKNAIGDVRKENTKDQNGNTIDPNKDDAHPNNKTPGMALIGKEIDSIIDIISAPSQITPSPTPTPAGPTPTPTPTPKPEEFEDIAFLPEREDSPIKLIQEALHIDEEMEEFYKVLEGDQIPDLPPDEQPIDLKPIDINGITTYMVAYMLHQQGPAGGPAALYYTFKEPKAIVGKPNKFGNFDLSGNMYGFYLRDSSKYTNVGSDFFKLFPNAKSKTQTSSHKRYINKPKYYVGWVDTSYFTIANFVKYYIYKWDAIYKAGNKPGACPSNIEPILIKYAKKHGVPLDMMKAECYIESRFNPNSGNERYKGLFALGKPVWDDFYKSSKISFERWAEPELNADAGGKLTQTNLLKANSIINQYVK